MTQSSVRVEKKSGENWKVRVTQDGQTAESEFASKEDATRYAKVQEKRLGLGK